MNNSDIVRICGRKMAQLLDELESLNVPQGVIVLTKHKFSSLMDDLKAEASNSRSNSHGTSEKH